MRAKSLAILFLGLLAFAAPSWALDGKGGTNNAAGINNLVNYVLNVKTDYGAKGDGTTDDTAALQAALTACVAPFGVVYLPTPASSYKITATGSGTGGALLIPTGCKVYGNGYSTVIKPTGTWVTNSQFLQPANGAQGVTIQDLAIDVSAGITVTGRTFADGVENTTTTLTSATAAFTSADVGISVSGNNIPANTTISSVTNGTTVILSQAETGTASGVTIQLGGRVNGAIFGFQAQKYQVEHVKIVDNLNWVAEGIACDGCQDSSVDDSEMDNVWGTGAIFQSVSAATSRVRMHHNIVRGTQFGNGLYCHGAGNQPVTDCIIDDNEVTNFADTGIECGSDVASSINVGCVLSNNRVTQTAAASGKAGELLKDAIISNITGGAVSMCGAASGAMLLGVWAADTSAINNTITGVIANQTCASGNAAGPVIWLESASSSTKVTHTNIVGVIASSATGTTIPTFFCSPYCEFTNIVGGSFTSIASGGDYAINFDCTSANCPGNTVDGATLISGFNNAFFTHTTNLSFQGNQLNGAFNAALNGSGSVSQLAGDLFSNNLYSSAGAVDSFWKPSVATCGTGTVANGSNDWSGTVTATGATACTVNFKSTKNNAPTCTVVPQSGSIPTVGAPSTSGFTVTGLTSGAAFMYHCDGN
jgi:hypothetical protein